MSSPLTEDELAEVIMSVGTHRKIRQIPPVEVARRIERALSWGVSYGTEFVHYDKRTLAMRLGFKDPGMIDRFLVLLSIPEEFQKIVNWGSGKGSLNHLTFSIASFASHLPPERRGEFILEVLRHELTKEHAKAAIQLLKRDPRKSVSECVAEIRPVVTEHEILVGTFPAASAMLDEALPIGRKESILNRVVGGILGDERFAVRLSNTHFIISTSEKGKRRLKEYSKAAGLDLNALITERCEKSLSPS